MATEYQHTNFYAPNLMNICIDSENDGDTGGRLYCYYQKSAILFHNQHELLRIMDDIMNDKNFPQSSVNLRRYTSCKEKKHDTANITAIMEEKERQQIIDHRGLVNTLLVHVKYRQKATWQGTVYQIGKDNSVDFLSELELLKIIQSFNID